LALGTKSYTTDTGILGIECLLFGGLAITFGKWVAFGAWLANVFFFFGLTIKNERVVLKLIFSTIAILLSLLAFTITELPLHEGTLFTPVSIGIGCYFWVASIGLFFVKSFLSPSY
jgi:hypothetical protein